jgi:hypothetical protein
MARNYVALPYDYLEEMSLLNNEEFGRLVRGLLLYGSTGDAPDLPGNERFLFPRVKAQEDRFRENYEYQASINRENGAKGGRPPKPKKTEKNRKKPKQTEKTQTETETETENYTEAYAITPLKSPQGDGFDRFWAIYPRKIGKQAALKSWSRLNPSIELTQGILQAVEYQKTWEQWQKDGGKYIPNPATWLNQGRWEDEKPGEQRPFSWAELAKQMDEQEGMP